MFASKGSKEKTQTTAERAKRTRLLRVLGLAGMFVAGIAAVGLLNAGIEYTNTTEFCTSCHTMSAPYASLQEGRHHMNAPGVHAGCADCHVPKPVGPKLATKFIAAKDVWHEILGTIDTPEKYEERRWIMAQRIWDKMERTNSRECRSCHEIAHMDLSAQGRTARSRHSRAEERGQTCIDCHAGVAHGMPTKPDDA